MNNIISFFKRFQIGRKTFFLMLIISVTLLTVFLSDIWLSQYIEKEIKARIELLGAKAESIKITLINRTLRVKSLDWASTPDRSNLRQHSIRIKTLTARGISLYELFKNNTVIFNKVTIDSGQFQFDRSSKSIFPKAGDFEAPVFKFRSILLNSVETQVTLDSLVSFSAVLNCELKEVNIEKSLTAAIIYSAKSAEGAVTKISMSRHEGMYGMTIASIAFDTDAKQLTFDSALVIPNYEKYEFARHAGRQVGRLNLSIPKITITGLDFHSLADTSWIASKVEIASIDLYSFKDKRVSDLPIKIKAMPMEGFVNLPYLIKVDSILIHKSHIVVEEFPETGIESGTITFNDLSCTLTNLNNRIKEGDLHYATLKASALLMNDGRINATFLFPLDGTPTYKAEGTVTRMSFAALNPILTSMADVRVESGYLNNMRFNFEYTDYVSKGSLELDYEDFHIIVLDKNKKSTNEFKTLLANAFLKNSIAQKETSVKSSAAIDIQRDRSKYIFNLWAKSVLDGVRNSMLKSFAKNSSQKKLNDRRQRK